MSFLVAMSILVLFLVTVRLLAPPVNPPARWNPRSDARLNGEALFATGLDRHTVDLDCLVARSITTDADAVAEPLCLRVRTNSGRTGSPLSAVVRRWAEGGERVHVELDLSRRCGVAMLRCGSEQVVTEVANGLQAWTRLTAPPAPEVAGG